MQWRNVLRVSLVSLSVLGLGTPQFAWGANTVDSIEVKNTKIHDVSLQQDGSLHGQVVNSAGVAVADTEVALAAQDRVIARVKTDKQGRYKVSGLKSGLYVAVTEKGFTVCRLWNQSMAPPAAQPGALIVNGDEVLRGQIGNGPVIRFLSNPLVLTGIVAAAIAIPLALDDSSDGS